MRILYVEDKEDFAEMFVGFIREQFDGVEVDVARCLNESVKQLGSVHYDLAILDLAIPKEENGVARVEVGSELARLIGQDYSGTPILVFTGQTDERETDELRFELTRQIRFLGGAQRPYLAVQRKDRMERVLAIIGSLRQEEASARTVVLGNLENGALGDECPEQDRRLIRGFCRFREGARGRVRRFGGLSGSVVYRIDVLSSEGATLQRSVAKFGSGSSIEKEISNYNNLVTRLPSGYPPAITVDLTGGGSRRAAFYNLADGYEVEFFDLVNYPLEIVTTIRRKLRNWHENRERASCSIRELVGQIAGPKGLEKLNELPISGMADVLTIEVECFRSVQHGDLHGSNILCKQDGTDVCLIDFGDVADLPVVFDVATLELSVFFHPASSVRAEVQGLKKLLPNWFNDQELQLGGFPAWALSLRRWAREVSLSHLEYAAVVLAYSARQLKYDDTDHESARTLISAAVAQLRDA